MSEIILECCGMPESQCNCGELTQEEKLLGANRRLQRCPYRQDLRLYCGEKDCTRAGCPIYQKETGYLAQAIEYSKGGIENEP